MRLFKEWVPPDMPLTQRTLIALRERLVGFTLAEIDNLFASAELKPDDNATPNVNGQRRFRVEQYYAALNVNDPRDVKRLLEVVEDVLEVDPGEYSAALVKALKRDGFLVEGANVVALDPLGDVGTAQLADLSTRMNAAHLSTHIKRMRNAVNSDPDLAIGTAKELIEAVSKTILHEAGKPVEDKPNMPQLIRRAAAELQLMPDDIPSAAKGADLIRQLLSNLMTIADRIAELRGLYGTGHGQDGRWRGVTPRHARLAVEATVALTTFLMETQLERKPWADPSEASGRYTTRGFRDGKSGAEINILSLGNRKFEVHGYAIHVDDHLPDERKVPRTGDFHQVIESDGLFFDIKSGACEVAITRSGTELSVKDNSACGGLNVSFTGEFKRVGHPHVPGG